MIETTVRDYLAEQLPVPVFLERPETPPECYVLLEKLSAKEREGIGKASFAMQSVSGSLYAAAQLSGMVRAAMAQAVVLPEISRASLANEYNFTDPTTRTYRYQADVRADLLRRRNLIWQMPVMCPPESQRSAERSIVRHWALRCLQTRPHPSMTHLCRWGIPAKMD